MVCTKRLKFACCNNAPYSKEMALACEVLLINNQVWCSDTKTSVSLFDRYPNGQPHNAWERALYTVQTQRYSKVDLSPVERALHYCAAHVLLGRRNMLLHKEYVEGWYLDLNDFPCHYNETYSLGDCRAWRSVEWVHAHAMRDVPLESIWCANKYWSTQWAHWDAPRDNEFHSERWSFDGLDWHIERWACTPTAVGAHWSGIAPITARCEAIGRIMKFDDVLRNEALSKIPANIRIESLFDCLVQHPEYEALLLKNLAHYSTRAVDEWSVWAVLARELNLTASFILKNQPTKNVLLSLPLVPTE